MVEVRARLTYVCCPKGVCRILNFFFERTRLGFGSGLPSTLLLLKLAMPSCFHNKKIYVFLSLFFPILWELLLVLSKSALMSLSKGSPVIPQCSREG